MIKKIIIITGTEARHDFLRLYISNDKRVEVLKSYCETSGDALVKSIKEENITNDKRLNHLLIRENTEKDFFELYNQSIPNQSNEIYIPKGDINKEPHVNEIIKLNPDLIISYGCSIIKSRLLSIFQGRFINIHLGLSPYYRGSGTNFWPIVNNELQFIGTTFMFIDSGIDTGPIIHQIRGDIWNNDNIHQIGNRLIRDSVKECLKLICYKERFKISTIQNDNQHNIRRYYKKSDFNLESLDIANKNILNGCVSEYLNKKNQIDKKFPIIRLENLI